MKQDTIASKVGRPPKFKTPEELQEKAEGYFQYCDTHPIEVWQRKAAAANQSAKNGSGVKSDEGTMYIRRPYTLDGLGLWLEINDWRHFRAYHQAKHSHATPSIGLKDLLYCRRLTGR